MPPRCCNVDVQHSRNQSGVHCAGCQRFNSLRLNKDYAYLGKASVYDEIQYATEELITHENGGDQITEHKGTSICPRILPDVDGREKEPSAVHETYSDVELPVQSIRDSFRQQEQFLDSPIRVEPELKLNPTADFPLRFLGRDYSRYNCRYRHCCNRLFIFRWQRGRKILQ